MAVPLSLPRSERSSFVRARLGSFLSVFPLGVWTACHLWNNLSAWGGETPEEQATRWQRAVTEHPHPLAHALTLTVVLLPLLLHAAWGLTRLASSRPNNLRFRTFENLKYLLQRVSAVGLLLFLGAHMWLAMLKPRLFPGPGKAPGPEAFSDLVHEMHHHTPTLVVYLLGVLAVSYHLGNGLSTFAMGFGVVSSQGALKRAETLSLFVFLLLLLMGWGSVYALYQAGA